MTGDLQIVDEIFPGREIPIGLKKLLSAIQFSREDLLRASPSHLIDPFSLPGLGEILQQLTDDLARGRGLTVAPDGSPDASAASSLFRRIFKPYRRRIFLQTEPGGKGDLALGTREGLRYRRGGAAFSLSPAGPGGERYSAAGLIFKLGQGRQQTMEKGFGREYIAFDLETTGRDPRRDEIIEIGAVRVTQGRMGEEFSALVKPSRSLPRLITEITGITDRDLENAPPLSEVLPGFLDFAGSATLIGHNIDFDLAFLRRASRRLLGRKLTNDTFCTLLAARSRMPGQGHRLGEVAAALGIELKDWHRATADARAAAAIFLRFQEEDNAARRYDYFRRAVSGACLGTILAEAPISADNAVFFRHGFARVLSDYAAGERYFRRHPGREPESGRRLLSQLSSRWRRIRGRAVHRLVEKAREGDDRSRGVNP